MAINTTVGGIDLPAMLDHSGLRNGINVILVVGADLRVERADLQIRNHRQAHPRKREGSEQPKKERDQALHKCPSDSSPSTGFKNVGTVEVRRSRNNMSPQG